MRLRFICSGENRICIVSNKDNRLVSMAIILCVPSFFSSIQMKWRTDLFFFFVRENTIYMKHVRCNQSNSNYHIFWALHCKLFLEMVLHWSHCKGGNASCLGEKKNASVSWKWCVDVDFSEFIYNCPLRKMFLFSDYFIFSLQLNNVFFYSWTYIMDLFAIHDGHNIILHINSVDSNQ